MIELGFPHSRLGDKRYVILRYSELLELLELLEDLEIRDTYKRHVWAEIRIRVRIHFPSLVKNLQVNFWCLTVNRCKLESKYEREFREHSYTIIQTHCQDAPPL